MGVSGGIPAAEARDEARRQRVRAEKAETERNEWEARAVRAEEHLKLAIEGCELIRAMYFPLDDDARVQWAVDVFGITKAIVEGERWPGYFDPAEKDHQRVSARPDASTSDHERTPQEIVPILKGPTKGTKPAPKVRPSDTEDR